MVSVGFKTDRGRQRQNNEDSLFVLPEQQLYIVADNILNIQANQLLDDMLFDHSSKIFTRHKVTALCRSYKTRFLMGWHYLQCICRLP